jgi:hypothetical protein
MLNEEQKRILQFLEEQKANEGKVREAFGALTDLPTKEKQIQTLQAKVSDLELSQKTLEERTTALESELKANLDLVKDWQSKYESANKQHNKDLELLVAMTSEKNKYKGYYEKALNKAAEKLSTKELISIVINRLFKK